MELHFTEQEIYNMVDTFKSFYDDITDITQYYLKKKIERLEQGNFDLIDNKVFDRYDMDPMDMEFELVELSGSDFTSMVSQIASFPIESQIGRRITLGLKEKTTNQFVGFVRIASPVSAIKPRNDYFGEQLRLDKVNPHIYNGQTIVPVQPFGFNFLGGKLMSLVCISNEVRELFNQKYGTNILLFETTSLYGNSKSSSQYDGLEPYIKFRGLTESTNLLFPTDDVYFDIRNQCRTHYGVEKWGGMLVDPKPSSPKMREFNKVISIIKSHLKQFNPEMLKEFTTYIKERCETKQQKRFYTSDFGYKNIREHILTGVPLIDGDREKYDLKNLVNYWKKKSSKRYHNLIESGRLKTELEKYTVDSIKNGINFEMIR
jgi:hypothetical protein